MDKSFDFGALLRNHAKKHKSKPTQFVSVADGTKKRVENLLKHRRSRRLTTFDNIRDLPQTNRCDSPAPISEVALKMEHRRQQLQKWKEEKEKKKKELASHKLKPFITGVPHNTLKYVPPPPPPTRMVLSTSGRITRSQTVKNKNEAKDSRQAQAQSFAPINAAFRAPQIKNLSKIPHMAPLKTRKNMKVAATVTFQPVLPIKAQSEVKLTRSRAVNIVTDSRTTRNTGIRTRPNGNMVKPGQKAIPKYLQSSSSSENNCPQMQSVSSSNDDLTAKMLSSSSDTNVNNIYSSSENESAKSLQSSSSTEFEPETNQSMANKSRKSLTIVSSPGTKTKAQKSTKQSKSLRGTKQATEKLITPKHAIPKSESSSEERLRSPKSPPQGPQSPQNLNMSNKISPSVTLSRGKNNARKEMKMKLDEGLFEEDSSDLEIDHFRKQLSSEIKRITEMCDTWDKIYEQVELPENVQELVLGGVGQARLLMSQKLQQFSSLIERCARPEPGAALVTRADLQGFWDMVYMQVENVDIRFMKLEQLKARNWIEEAPKPVARRAKAPGKPAAKPAVKPKSTAGPSRLKEMIAAARKANKQDPPAPPAAEDKTFEAGFFCVRSPARSPRPEGTPRTPNNHNLLKAVLSSEAKKASATKNSASFAMLRASLLSKNMECDGVAPLPQTPVQPVNLFATPGRSILKQAQDSAKKLCNKSIKIVLFERCSDSNTSADNIQETNQCKTMNNTVQADTNTSTSILEQVLSPVEAVKDSAKKGKENSRRKKLSQQDVLEESSPVMTRNRRKSMQTPQLAHETQELAEKTPKRSARKKTKKVLDELKINVDEAISTPRRSRRSRRTAASVYEDAM